MSPDSAAVRYEVVPLSDIREALVEADNLLGGKCESVHSVLRRMNRIIKYRIGDLVEFQNVDGKWLTGVVVAYGLGRVRYICGRGDDRNKTGEALLGCPERFVTRRGVEHDA